MRGDMKIAGRTAIEVISPRSTPLDVPRSVRDDSVEPLIAICLATYEPPEALFARQIASIRAQEHRRFVCIVSDDRSSHETWSRIQRLTSVDPRFVCSRNAQRIGFYRNFEHCLSLVPNDAEFVALADQDDEWHVDKLSALIRSIERTGAELVFSDMNLVGDDGRMLSPTFWSYATNNFTRLDSLLLTNTITGAASLFKRRLLEKALPFPPAIGLSYHDHWLACVALASGKVAYVDSALYDYVQHDSNASGNVLLGGTYEGGLIQIARRFVAAPRGRVRSGLMNARTNYRADAVRLEVFGRELELRLGDRLDDADLRTVRRASRVFTSTDSLLWLLRRSLGDLAGRSATHGAENQLLKVLAWHRLQAFAAWSERAASRVVAR
jgi:glycosyltransferase involved in cell wall biosynthesis